MKRFLVITSLLLAMLLLLSACQEKGKEGEEKGTEYAFQSGETVIRIDAEAKAILDALGTCRAYSESPSCAFEGMDKVYTYNGFEVETYCLGDVDYIASVQLLDDSVKTREGISIGDTAEQVMEAYGEATESSTNALIYRAQGVTLQFLLRDGKVTNIQYLKNES